MRDGILYSVGANAVLQVNALQQSTGHKSKIARNTIRNCYYKRGLTRVVAGRFILRLFGAANRQRRSTTGEDPMDKIALLPRHKIFYTPNYFVDNARFVRVWRSTWARLPLRARRKLLAYWRTLPTHALGHAPRFHCVLGYISRHVKDCKAVGMWNFSDGSTHYLADAVNIMPDEILASLIAHELAHAVYRIEWKQQEPKAFRTQVDAELCLIEELPG